MFHLKTLKKKKEKKKLSENGTVFMNAKLHSFSALLQTLISHQQHVSRLSQRFPLKKLHYFHPDNYYYQSKPDDGLTQSSVPQSMFSLSAKLSDYPEYKELLQSYPSNSEDGPLASNPEVINQS